MQKFSQEILQKIKEEPFNNHALPENETASLNFAVYLYDAVILYARTVDRMLKEGNDIYNASLFQIEVGRTEFQGLSNYLCNLSRKNKKK